MNDDAYIELVKKKMDEWKCDLLFLATEDMEEAMSIAIATGKENVDENDRISYDCKK